MENPETADEESERATQVPWHRYFSDFPPGYRFKPSDEELVTHYLTPKLDERDLPPNIIREAELYQYNPDKLTEMHKPEGRNGEEWYFFTPRERKYRNGNRPKRRADDGYWKATGKDKEIKVGEDTIGFKKSLVFYRGDPPKGDKTNWIMHEFRTNGPKRIRQDPNDMQLDDWVLCRMYKKSAKAKDKDTATEEHSRETEEKNGEYEDKHEAEGKNGEYDHEVKKENVKDEDENKAVSSFGQTQIYSLESDRKRKRESQNSLALAVPSNPHLSPIINYSSPSSPEDIFPQLPQITYPGTSQSFYYLQDSTGIDPNLSFLEDDYYWNHFQS